MNLYNNQYCNFKNYIYTVLHDVQLTITECNLQQVFHFLQFYKTRIHYIRVFTLHNRLIVSVWEQHSFPKPPTDNVQYWWPVMFENTGKCVEASFLYYRSQCQAGKTLCKSPLHSTLDISKDIVYLNSHREPGGWGLPHQVKTDSLLSCQWEV